MSDPNAFGAHQVSRVLTEVGHRARLARLLPLSILVLAVGVAALGGAIVILGRDWPGAGWWIAGAVLLCLCAIGLAALRRDMRADVVARRLDHDLALSEQLSTASGAATRHADGPIVRALIAGAGRVASGVDVATAVPVGTKALGLSLAMLVVATCGTTLALSWLATAPVSDTVTPDMEQAASAGPAIAAQDIDTLAELVAADAERRNSDYLTALSNSLKTLAQAARDGASQAELETELQALLDHAEAGYQGQNPDWLGRPGEEPAGVLQNAVAFSQARQKAAEERARLAQLDGQGARVSSSEMYNLPQDRLAASATPQPAGNDPPSENAIADREGQLQSESLGGGDTLARPMEDEAFASAGSLPVGAAAQSGKGESNIAGGGSQSLADNSQFLETMADPTQSMSIAAADLGEGSRIRMHVPTGAELSDAASLANDGGTDWSRQMAQVVTRQAIAPDASIVVSRYFNRPAPGEDR